MFCFKILLSLAVHIGVCLVTANCLVPRHCQGHADLFAGRIDHAVID